MKYITPILYALLAAFLLDYSLTLDTDPAVVQCDGGEPEPYTAAEIDDAYKRATQVLQEAPLPPVFEAWWREQDAKL